MLLNFPLFSSTVPSILLFSALVRLARLESKHLTDLNPKEFGWKAPAAAGTEEDRTVWCGGIPADHPRLSELELRRFFANGFGAVEKVKLRTKTSMVSSTGETVGNHNGSWCLVTFVSMAAASKVLEYGVDINGQLDTPGWGEACPLTVRKSEIRQHLQVRFQLSSSLQRHSRVSIAYYTRACCPSPSWDQHRTTCEQNPHPQQPPSQCGCRENRAGRVLRPSSRGRSSALSTTTTTMPTPATW